MDGLFNLVCTFYVNKNDYFFFAGYELACIQCTSPIRRVSHNRDHPCLDGTLISAPCPPPFNESVSGFKNCVSALYRLGKGRNGGKKNN